MNKEPLINIIVPVYNTEKYIRKCLDSIVNQTYRNLEIIVVDDGSTDSSGDICDEYAHKDARIKVIHKENGGVSSARNAALDLCTPGGDLVAFVDSDDWLELNMYETLLEQIYLYNADIATCKISIEYSDNSRIVHKKIKSNICFSVKDKEELIKNFLNREIYTSSSNDKLYNLKLFSGIRFPVNQFYEDNYLVLEILLRAKKIVVGCDSCYHYRQNNNSITRNFSRKKFRDALKAIKHNLNLLKNTYPLLLKEAFALRYLTYLSFLDLLVFSQQSDHIRLNDKIRMTLKGHLKHIINSYNMTLQEKIAFIIVVYNTDLYKVLRKMQIRVLKREGY